ncbi:hypothetical protein [Streptomyces sp. Ru62]|uniref:hypothetical protein n=1 Tax=Streptomyces sp. Ru62 TaxID=2080745 RepID=UPI0011B083B8|nr:hypothetical protein [Streptomyces sp. Ru62]
MAGRRPRDAAVAVTAVALALPALRATLGATFGLLGERATRRSPRTAPRGGFTGVRTSPIEPFAPM